MDGNNEKNNEDHFSELIDLDPIEVKDVPFDIKPDYLKEIYQTIIYFIVVVAAVFIVNVYVVQQVQVDGSSMNYTLQDNDHLILEKLSYHFNKPSRFDIVVFKPYEGNRKVLYIKRIIGLPGENLRIKDGDIYINGILLNENYGLDEIIDAGIATNGITLGKNEYFVMGDNRNNSKDSRDRRVGVVKRSAILGRAYIRIWPIDKMCILKHQ